MSSAEQLPDVVELRSVFVRCFGALAAGGRSIDNLRPPTWSTGLFDQRYPLWRASDRRGAGIPESPDEILHSWIQLVPGSRLSAHPDHHDGVELLARQAS
jgi:hypothetical protein